MLIARGLAYGTAPPGLLLEVKELEVLVTDALYVKNRYSKGKQSSSGVR